VTSTPILDIVIFVIFVIFGLLAVIGLFMRLGGYQTR
jgi:hypothetical protein